MHFCVLVYIYVIFEAYTITLCAAESSKQQTPKTLIWCWNKRRLLFFFAQGRKACMRKQAFGILILIDGQMGCTECISHNKQLFTLPRFPPNQPCNPETTKLANLSANASCQSNFIPLVTAIEQWEGSSGNRLINLKFSSSRSLIMPLCKRQPCSSNHSSIDPAVDHC